MLSFAYPGEGNDDGEPLHATDSRSVRGSGARTAALGETGQDSSSAGVAGADRATDAAGKSDMEVAGQLGTTRATVGKWRRRFLRDGCDGLLDEPRPGAPRTIGDDDVERVVVQTLETIPAGATHWSTRSMAKACGLSAGR